MSRDGHPHALTLRVLARRGLCCWPVRSVEVSRMTSTESCLLKTAWHAGGEPECQKPPSPRMEMTACRIRRHALDDARPRPYEMYCPGLKGAASRRRGTPISAPRASRQLALGDLERAEDGPGQPVQKAGGRLGNGSERPAPAPRERRARRRRRRRLRPGISPAPPAPARARTRLPPPCLSLDAPVSERHTRGP